MTSIAADRVDSLGVGNVSTRELDLEEIDEPNGEYDVVLCREGLMLTPDPARAAAEITRVLRHGGRTAVAVWGPRERNPWLAIVLDSVSAELGTPMPPPGIPGPFSLDRADRLESTLAGAGLGQVSVHELETPYHAASVDEWWERTCDLAGPLAQKLAELPDAKRRALRERAERAIRIYETSDGLDMPGVTLVAGGARQS
jgi:SAM-dependent methyltransferase